MKLITVVFNGEIMTFEEDVKKHFLTQEKTGSYQDKTGPIVNFSKVEGKFLIFETQETVSQVSIFVFKIDACFLPAHSVVASKIKLVSKIKKNELRFIGGGYVHWSGNDFMNKLPPQEKRDDNLEFWSNFYAKVPPSAQFDSESCYNLFGYDRPRDEQRRTELLNFINESVARIRDESLLDS